MDFSQHALNILSEHLGQSIKLDDTGYESYIFEVDELDRTIIPANYQSYLARYMDIMSHSYIYEELIVFVLYPLTDSSSKQIFIGLLHKDKLLSYRIITGGI